MAAGQSRNGGLAEEAPPGTRALEGLDSVEALTLGF